MSEIDGVRMYFGTASGSARKALRKIEEPHIMLSAQSKCGVPWDGIENLFLDSGGYSLMLDRGEHVPTDDYIDTVIEYDADWFAIQDYPCEPEILDSYGRSVREHQRRTTTAAAENLTRAQERDIDAKPVAVLQGWETGDYVEHADELREEGLLTEHVGIGSICRRGQTEEIRDIIRAVDAHTPQETKLHAFGAKNEILSEPTIRDILWSADTTAWYYRNYQERTTVDETWQEMVMQYLNYRRQLAKIAGTLHNTKQEQQTITEW